MAIFKNKIFIIDFLKSNKVLNKIYFYLTLLQYQKVAYNKFYSLIIF